MVPEKKKVKKKKKIVSEEDDFHRDISRGDLTCVHQSLLETTYARAEPEPTLGGSGACSPGKILKSKTANGAFS